MKAADSVAAVGLPVIGAVAGSGGSASAAPAAGQPLPRVDIRQRPASGSGRGRDVCGYAIHVPSKHWMKRAAWRCGHGSVPCITRPSTVRRQPGGSSGGVAAGVFRRLL